MLEFLGRLRIFNAVFQYNRVARACQVESEFSVFSGDQYINGKEAIRVKSRDLKSLNAEEHHLMSDVITEIESNSFKFVMTTYYVLLITYYCYFWGSTDAKAPRR